MIVRLLGEGQFRIADDLFARLNELDDRAQASLEAGDESALDGTLEEMWSLVRAEGERLPDDELATSDAVIPPRDLTLVETEKLFSPEGLIPDVSS